MLRADLEVDQYPELLKSLSSLPEADRIQGLRWLARNDLWFLLRYLLNRKDLDQVTYPAWLFARVREVQNEPDGRLDIWAREHYKSTIITFGKTIQDVLKYHGDEAESRFSEPTFCIFSHVRPIAKAFLRQIRSELEWNQALKDLFPDILYQTPEREAPLWSLDDGIVVRRSSTQKEATIEASGLVDSQPTSKHYNFLIYDDVVTLQSVTNPEMIDKTTEALEMSYNLGAGETCVKRYIGTRYHFADTYRQALLDRQAAIPRIYPCTESGNVEGRPVLRSREFLDQRYREMGPYVFASQMLCNPTADTSQGFKREWFNHYERDPMGEYRDMNRYVLVDPASSKKPNSDYTAIWVWGLGRDKNMYLLDAYRDRLNLRERVKLVMDVHDRWKPKKVGYEQYGLQADIEYLKQVMEDENYRFPVEELGGKVSKTDRIKRLIPHASEGRIYLPNDLYRTLSDGKEVELMQVLMEEEILMFPVSIHDDLLDAGSRLFDLEFRFPRARDLVSPDRWQKQKRRIYSYMAT